MKIKLTFMILASFLFTQIACAMSEAGEIFLEAVEHNLLDTAGHDASAENHNEITEHNEELSGVSHCVHSHPPITLMFSDTHNTFEAAEIEFNATLIQLSASIYHRPPIAPPIS